MPIRYYFRLSDAGQDDKRALPLGFQAQGAGGRAQELQDALREDHLFQRWRARQDDPDAVDPALGATDPGAVVEGRQRDLHIDLTVTTSIPGNILNHRLRMLAGSGWTLRDVTAA